MCFNSAEPLLFYRTFSAYILRTYLQCFSYHRHLFYRVFPLASSPLLLLSVEFWRFLFRYDEAPRSSLVRFWDSKRKRPARGSVYFLIVSLFWVCSAYPLVACTPPDCCWLDATWLPIDFHKMKDVSVVPCGARPFGAPHCRGHERRARFRMDIVPMVAFCIPPSLSTALWSAS